MNLVLFYVQLHVIFSRQGYLMVGCPYNMPAVQPCAFIVRAVSAPRECLTPSRKELQWRLDWLSCMYQYIVKQLNTCILAVVVLTNVAVLCPMGPNKWPRMHCLHVHFGSVWMVDVFNMLYYCMYCAYVHTLYVFSIFIWMHIIYPEKRTYVLYRGYIHA